MTGNARTHQRLTLLSKDRLRCTQVSSMA